MVMYYFRKPLVFFSTKILSLTCSVYDFFKKVFHSFLPLTLIFCLTPYSIVLLRCYYHYHHHVREGHIVILERQWRNERDGDRAFTKAVQASRQLWKKEGSLSLLSSTLHLPSFTSVEKEILFGIPTTPAASWAEDNWRSRQERKQNSKKGALPKRSRSLTCNTHTFSCTQILHTKHSALSTSSNLLDWFCKRIKKKILC